MSVADFTYAGTQEVVHVEGVTASEFLDMSIQKPAERIFRVIVREAQVCCPAGGSTVALALDNARWEEAEYNYKLTFEWSLK